MMQIPAPPPLIGLDEAAQLCDFQSVATMRDWVRRAKLKDPYFVGLPYHQVAPKSKIKFNRERLIHWWNCKTNVGLIKDFK